MIYPIFAPFFNFSYRRKRKMNLTADHLGVVDSSSEHPPDLGATNRYPTSPSRNNCALFENFHASPLKSPPD